MFQSLSILQTNSLGSLVLSFQRDLGLDAWTVHVGVPPGPGPNPWPARSRGPRAAVSGGAAGSSRARRPKARGPVRALDKAQTPPAFPSKLPNFPPQGQKDAQNLTWPQEAQPVSFDSGRAGVGCEELLGDGHLESARHALGLHVEDHHLAVSASLRPSHWWFGLAVSRPRGGFPLALYQKAGGQNPKTPIQMTNSGQPAGTR